MRTNWLKWVRIDQMRTNWPKKNFMSTNWSKNEYEFTKMRANWLKYELTWERIDFVPLWLIFSGSNNPCLEQIYMVQKMFEPLVRLYIEGRGYHRIFCEFHSFKLFSDIRRNHIKYPWRLFPIMETYLYNFDPLKPHFYIVKLGFTGVYIIFLISAQKHRLWVLVRTASMRRF